MSEPAARLRGLPLSESAPQPQVRVPGSSPRTGERTEVDLTEELEVNPGSPGSLPRHSRFVGPVSVQEQRDLGLDAGPCNAGTVAQELADVTGVLSTETPSPQSRKQSRFCGFGLFSCRRLPAHGCRVPTQPGRRVCGSITFRPLKNKNTFPEGQRFLVKIYFPF